MYSLPGRALYIGLGNYWILNKNETIDIITEITGGLVGDFHIISDEGKGTTRPPVLTPVEEPVEDTGLKEGEDTLPVEGEDPGTEQVTDPGADPEPDNTSEQPVVEPPVTLPIPEPVDEVYIN